jgi:hypothetical protein
MRDLRKPYANPRARARTLTAPLALSLALAMACAGGLDAQQEPVAQDPATSSPMRSFLESGTLAALQAWSGEGQLDSPILAYYDLPGRQLVVARRVLTAGRASDETAVFEVMGGRLELELLLPLKLDVRRQSRLAGGRLEIVESHQVTGEELVLTLEWRAPPASG